MVDLDDYTLAYGQVPFMTSSTATLINPEKWDSKNFSITLPKSIELHSALDLKLESICKVKLNFDNLIEKVIFNGPATIVKWKDGSKTVVKCMDSDEYDQEKGLMMAIMEYLLGGTKGDVKRFFKKYIPEEEHTYLYDDDLKKVISSMMNSVFTFGFHKEEDEKDEH